MLALYTERATDANGPHLVDTAIDRSLAESQLRGDLGDGQETIGLRHHGLRVWSIPQARTASAVVVPKSAVKNQVRQRAHSSEALWPG